MLDFVMYLLFTGWCILVAGYLWFRSQWKKGKVRVMVTKNETSNTSFLPKRVSWRMCHFEEEPAAVDRQNNPEKPQNNNNL